MIEKYFKTEKESQKEILKPVEKFFQEISELEKKVQELQKEGHLIKERDVVFRENISKDEVIEAYKDLLPFIHLKEIHYSKDITNSFKKRFPHSPVIKVLEYSDKERKVGLRFIRFSSQRYTVLGFVKGRVEKNK